MTSNIGSEEIARSKNLGFETKEEGQQKQKNNSKQDLKRKIEEKLREYFKPEFLNRIDEIIIFDFLSQKEIEKIVDLQLTKIQKRLSERRIKITITPKAKKYLSKVGFDPNLGARPLKRTIQNLVLNPLAQMIIESKIKPEDRVKIDEKDGKIIITPMNKK